MPLKIGPGIDSIPTDTIPDDPEQFVSWFKSIALKRWFANADVRNALPGLGVTISGNISTPATISVGDEVQSLFLQPYLLAGPVVPPAPLTDFRTLAAQGGVLTLTDGGPESTLTVSVESNGIGNPQLRQSAAASVVGNSTAAPANVADITAVSDNTTLVRVSGALSFSSLPLQAIASIANLTVIGNSSGGAAAPVALSQAQLTALVNRTNPTAKVGLTAVNGSAGTMMDSASAPPIDQDISPIWTGNHTNTPASGDAITINGAVSSSGIVITPASAGASFVSSHGASSNIGMFVSGALALDIKFLQGGHTGGNPQWMLVAPASSDELHLKSGAGVDVAGFTQAGDLKLARSLGLNGVTPPSQVTGFGTPTGPSVVANFSGTAATNAQMQASIAEILTILKANGMIGA